MSGIPDSAGDPAFPSTDVHGFTSHGLSARQYAAIKLRVPTSGSPWLDKMIIESKRDEFAGQALAGLLARDLIGNSAGNTALQWANVRPDDGHWMPRLAYQHADAMLAARQGGDR